MFQRSDPEEEKTLPFHQLPQLATERRLFTRISCGLGFVLVLLFGLLDVVVDFKPLWLVWTIRVCLSSMLAFTFWLSYRSWFDRYYLHATCTIYLVTFGGILILPFIAHGNRIVSEHYYVGALLCFGAMMTLTLFSYRVVLTLSLIFFAAHMIMASVLIPRGVPLEIIATQTFMLVGLASFSFVGIRFRNNMLAERLQLSKQLLTQIAIARRLSMEKSRFMTAASHDLRQPLQVIALETALLEKSLRGQAQYPSVARMMRAIDEVSLSMDSMQDISRLDAGLVSADKHDVDLNSVFLSLHNAMAEKAEAKGLQWRLRSNGLHVHTDPALLHRLLLSLVDNAIKYTPRGGVLVVARLRGKFVWLDVIDTGIGIATDQLDLIFEEFYQINNPGRDRMNGLGLGLTMVKRLAELLDHPLELRSKPGRGTRLRLILPLVQSPALDA